MKLRRLMLAAAAILGALMLAPATRPAFAQDARSKFITLWVDPATGQLFTRPGRGRRAFIIPSAGVDTAEIESHVARKVEQDTAQSQQQMQAQLTQTQQQTQDVSRQMAEIRPAWQDYVDNFRNKFTVGTLVYADWRFYSHTGYGPQEMTQVNAPGPGNNAFNSFDISRAYINLFFNPTDDWTVRVTPNIYRINGSENPDGFGNGKNSAINSNLSGELGYRLKYAYLQYKKAFDMIEPLKGDTITFGQAPNPLVDWQENLYGFRYVNLTPWNYLSLSSTQQGVSIQGPVKFNGLQYVEYDFGAYNNANFHQFEQTNTKQVMGRVSVYPLGALWRFDGLGLTAFYDYGYNNSTPDNTTGSANKGHITRAAILAHYTAEQWGLGGEYDWGHNAVNAGNMFSSSGPPAAFSYLSGTSPSAGPSADFGTLSKALLNNGRATQKGVDFFGHVHIPTTPFTAFGMFQWFQPNTKVDFNPLDFQRWVAGVSYQYNEFMRFALTSQNLSYYHDQFNFPQAYANKFTSEKYNNTAGIIPDAVPRDNHSFWLSAEFSY